LRRRIAALLIGSGIAVTMPGVRSQPGPVPATSARLVIDTYCVSCHNQRLRTGGLELESLNLTNPGTNADVWEKVIAKLRAGSMPPPGRPRPDAATYRAVANTLEREMDRAWAANPDPGRMAAVHRLNRAEYGNAVRDLFALDPLGFDVKALLPGDETADGSFDNFADVLSISTAHLERYLSVARQVTVGDRPAACEPRDRDLRNSPVRDAGRSAERGSSARVSRRNRDPSRLPG
jgi:hypothetical protein